MKVENKDKDIASNLPTLICDKCQGVPLITFTTLKNSEIGIRSICQCGEKNYSLSEYLDQLGNNQIQIDSCKTCEKGKAEHFCVECKKTFCVQCEYMHFNHQIIKEEILMDYIRTEKRKEFNTEGYHKLIKDIEEKTKNIISLIYKQIERNKDIIKYIDILSNTFDKQNCNHNLIMNACTILNLSLNPNRSKSLEVLDSLSEELSKNTIAQVQNSDNTNYIEKFTNKDLIELTERNSVKIQNKVSYMNDIDGIKLTGYENGRVYITESKNTLFDSKVHSSAINYIVYNNNNLITCSIDKKIIITPQPFETANQIQLVAHEDSVNKVIVFHDGKIISCSNDRTVIIWEKKNNAYENIQVIEHKDWVNSILEITINSKHYLVSGLADEDPSIIFWVLGSDNKFIEEKKIEKVECCYRDSMKQVSDEILLVGGLKTISIIDITILEKVQTINIESPLKPPRYIINFLPVNENKDAVIVLSNNSIVYCNYIKKFCYELKNKKEKLLGLFTRNSNIISYSNNKIIEWEIK